MNGTLSIFPPPREYTMRDDAFLFGDETYVVLGTSQSDDALRLPRLLMRELADRHGQPLRMRHENALPANAPRIVIGTLSDPTVRQVCERYPRLAAAQVTEAEGYLLSIAPDLILIVGADAPGAFYGLQTLRQMIRTEKAQTTVPGALIRDWPHLPFRGVRVYMPGRENLTFFKRFLADCLALYKFNKLILEPNGGMRLDRHPEVNIGWREFGDSLRATRRERPVGPHGEQQDSTHHDTADGGVLEKDEVAEIARWARENHIEIIPEIACLTHSYYLLARHRELAEIADAEWPDTYCPSRPESYALLYDIFDEYIEVFRPQMVNIGHDEWRIPWGVCPLCQDKDPRDLFAQDVKRIHAYLTGKGVRIAFWGDHLIEPLRGVHLGVPWYQPPGFPYRTPGALSEAQIRQDIPKDILIFNWFWDDRAEAQGEVNDRNIAAWGFQQVYGNFLATIQNFSDRARIPGVLGGVPSFWAASTEFNFGTDFLPDALPCASLLWTGQKVAETARAIQPLMPDIRRRLSGTLPPSESGREAVPIAIGIGPGVSEWSLAPSTDWLPPRWQPGLVEADSIRFHLGEPGAGRDAILVGVEGAEGARLPLESPPIAIGEDVESLVFLHACAVAVPRKPSFAYIYNFEDTTALLGWYEVVYEDGLQEAVALRHGVNILPWNWQPEEHGCCYGAQPLACGETSETPCTLFRYEWVNSRPGKAIRHVTLKGARRFAFGETFAPENALLLCALSAIKPLPGHAERRITSASETDFMKL